MPDDAGAAARDLLSYIEESPTPFHACAAAARRLGEAGFEEVGETDPWPHGGRHWFVRDGSLVAWVVPNGATATTPFRIVGAHTDSPNLRVKPNPDVRRAGAGLVAVEVYGGALYNSWLDRDLGIAGRLALRDGRITLVRVDHPVARIPQLAIHLDRNVNTEGLTLNPQQHLTPVWTLDTTAGFAAFVSAAAGVDETDVVFWDLMFHDVEPGALLGRDGELISAPRLDNLCSCWAAIEALIATAAQPAGAIAVAALFDHEEVGSSSNRGAASTLLATALERINGGLGGTRDDWHRAIAGSTCVSADMAHATHPNYPERHEPGHWIALGGGPVVKTNVSQRYASDARSVLPLLTACARAGIGVQQYTHRADLPCGSTIGPITAARLGISTVDIGAPQLSMHSARELMATADLAPYRDVMAAFLAG